VTDAAKAYEECIRHGGQAAMAPRRLACPKGGGAVVVAEVRAYGDVVLRFVSREDGFEGLFLPGYEYTPPPRRALNYGLERVDHAVGNVWDLIEAVDYMAGMTGFHEFAEFVAEDVGTTDSGLNSVVLASNEENVLLPLNEPTYGTRRKSQIQTYLEQNNGPGLQHLALKTDDIFRTVRTMREMGELGGFDFQDRPSEQYYRSLPTRLVRPHAAAGARRITDRSSPHAALSCVVRRATR
jgi:4-hydroxyphenylpyruvate dioxygenase